MRLTQNEAIARNLLYKCVFFNQPTVYLSYKTQNAKQKLLLLRDEIYCVWLHTSYDARIINYLKTVQLRPKLEF